MQLTPAPQQANFFLSPPLSPRSTKHFRRSSRSCILPSLVWSGLVWSGLVWSGLDLTGYEANGVSCLMPCLPPAGITAIHNLTRVLKIGFPGENISLGAEQQSMIVCVQCACVLADWPNIGKKLIQNTQFNILALEDVKWLT